MTKEVKDLHTENYKTLIKEIKEDIGPWKDIPCSRIERINIVQMIILPKAIYRFKAILIKLPMMFFTELEQIIQKIIWNHNPPHPHQDLLEQSWGAGNKKAGGITLPDCGLYHKATIIKTVFFFFKAYGSMEQNIKPRNKPTHLWSINLQQKRHEYKIDTLFSK